MARERDDDDRKYGDEDHPQSFDKRINRLSHDHLRSIALYQKGILMCILVYTMAVVAQYFIPQELRLLVGLLAAFPVCIAATVFVFLLATKVYNPVAGIILGFLTLIPCVGMIVLLIINGKATSVLKQNGISVGLMGADLSDLK